MMESSEKGKSLAKVQDCESLKKSLDSESRLQSLGFIINNGKARFILEDDTPMYSNAVLTNFSITDPNDTLSFVVLGKDSMDVIQASSIASYNDIERKSMSVDYNSMIASWNSDEIHEKLSELLQENEKLKETLKQNNIAMRQQFNSLFNWQEQIMKIHQSHKKKFAETRELINYLKKENNEFKIRLATEGTSTEPGYEMLSVNEVQSTDKKESSILQTDLHEKISSDMEKLLGISNLVSSQLKEATTTIQEQRLNIQKLEMQGSMSKLYDSNYFNRSINHDSSKHVESINKCTNCENCLEKDKEINTLKESLAVLQQTELVKQYIEGKQSLEESMNLLVKEKESLKIKEQLLDSQKKDLEMERKNLNEAMELLEEEKISLYGENSSLDPQSQLCESHCKTILEAEKNKCDLKCYQLINEIGILHETIEEKELHLKQLGLKIIQHVEHIALLRTQLELYEEDFKQERRKKEEIMAENNELNMAAERQRQIIRNLQEHTSTFFNGQE